MIKIKACRLGNHDNRLDASLITEQKKNLVKKRGSMKVSSNSRKKAEAQQLQIEVFNDDDWNNILKRQGLLVVDVYARWCGPCTSMTGHLRRIKMELGDDCLTLATAEADSITDLAAFRGKAEPTFIFFGSGKPICVVHGADGPKLLQNIRELLKYERNLARGKAQKTTKKVLLDSLVKPEEVIESDEDLDDVEREQPENDESDDEDLKKSEAVLLISPNIIATDRIEDFLSHLVSAGMTISGHVQEEISNEELLLLLRPPLPKPDKLDDSSIVEASEEQNKNTNEEPQEKEEMSVVQEDSEPPEPNLQFWEEELSKGPLYMLLLRVENGDIFQAWETLLGPSDLATAKESHPESLVAQFGDEDLVLPAWLPVGISLQQRLRDQFFSPTPDADTPRLLLLPDADDHQQVLEALCSGGLQVLAHTQVLLTEEALSVLHLTSSAENLKDYVGSQLLAAVITGENAAAVSTELRSFHLTSNAENSVEEISAFFPDLAADLTNEQPAQEEPQTQMQIEQKKENITK